MFTESDDVERHVIETSIVTIKTKIYCFYINMWTLEWPAKILVSRKIYTGMYNYTSGQLSIR